MVQNVPRLNPGLMGRRLDSGADSTYFDQGRIKERKKGYWLCHSYAVPMIQWASNPYCPNDH